MSQLSTSPSAHRDPFHRRASFHLPAASLPHSSQQRRRSAALAAQQARRQHAFMAARSGLPNSVDAMGDLSLSSESDDDDGQFADAGGQVPEGPSRVEWENGKKRKAGMGKAKYRPWARDLLMWAETFDLSAALPARLEEDWTCVVVPKGKRVLCSSGFDFQGPNTALLSRVSGRTLQKRRSDLPPDSLLDCVWDEELSVLWVLDLVRWRGTWFVECEAQMRSYFLTSKLAELPPQVFLPPSPSSPFLLLPCPQRSPLPCPTLVYLISSLTPATITPTVLVPSASTPSTPLVQSTITVPFTPTGLLLYLSTAHYESGTTTLAGWVPLAVEPEFASREGVARLAELVQAWAERGGTSAGDPSGMEEVEPAEAIEEIVTTP